MSCAVRTDFVLSFFYVSNQLSLQVTPFPADELPHHDMSGVHVCVGLFLLSSIS